MFLNAKQKLIDIDMKFLTQRNLREMIYSSNEQNIKSNC